MNDSLLQSIFTLFKILAQYFQVWEKIMIIIPNNHHYNTDNKNMFPIVFVTRHCYAFRPNRS